MERRAIAIRGTVQGVGFRPFVYGLAARLDLGGFVQNQNGAVCIEVEGESAPLDQFLDRLVSSPPPLARIDGVTWQPRAPLGDRRFRIASSDRGSSDPITVAADAATCDACRFELFDPTDRRYKYPFINCTNCGPRLTIVTGAPYDRERTTMAGFRMCRACRAEYEDPANRRFHAQPNACPVCGPRIRALDGHGRSIESDDPLSIFVEALRAGRIGAMKGLGGYHLICDARHADAVAALRARKHRDEKPFAVMVENIVSAEALCEIDDAERKLLTSSRRPIVLLRQHGNNDLARQVAPDNPYLGVMLPYTPLHHLLLREMGGIPLVMTSGNRSDEPIAYDEPDAIERLSGIADVFLVHDRPIHVRCDDSVTRVINGAESPIRRSRGYAPQPIPLPMSCPECILAVGGQMKATFALGNERRAMLSHHLGNLDNFEAFGAFEKDVALYEELFEIKPSCIVHDLHPDYASTRYAQRRQTVDGIKCLAVQHHHAHMASCMAENGLTGPVIGVTLDGTGFGTDGAIWGGEFLVGDYRIFRRAAHLRYVAMPGGEKAVREPWRMAAAHLLDARASCVLFESRIPAGSSRTIRRMIDRRFNSPMTSSAGRLFDAVASLAGIRDAVNYEGQAAMQLEWLATGIEPDGCYPFDIGQAGDAAPTESSLVIDTRPMIRAIAKDADAGIAPSRIARRFQTTLNEIICSVCDEVRNSCGVDDIVLSGGVFMNALLSSEATDRLTLENFRVYRHRLVPPNDGGLSLGQVAIAASQLTSAK
jgi:hydrogenase maturation protein HypF